MPIFGRVYDRKCTGMVGNREKEKEREGVGNVYHRGFYCFEEIEPRAGDLSGIMRISEKRKRKRGRWREG